jgi:hypothetical protein
MTFPCIADGASFVSFFTVWPQAETINRDNIKDKL